jgi:hypothetical protein
MFTHGHCLAAKDLPQSFGGQAVPDQTARQACLESVQQSDMCFLAEVPEEMPQPVNAVRLKRTGLDGQVVPSSDRFLATAPRAW